MIKGLSIVVVDNPFNIYGVCCKLREWWVRLYYVGGCIFYSESVGSGTATR
jgi:hypothetical protein